jgi:hypothetical protein
MPDDEFVQHLLDRNKALLSATDLPPTILKDLREWRTEDALDRHLHSLVDRCRDDGFGVWTRPSQRPFPS